MATTERHYAGLTPGVLREAPDVLERFISEKLRPGASGGGSQETGEDTAAGNRLKD